MTPDGRLSVRHPRQWWIDFLFAWSIVTLIASVGNALIGVANMCSAVHR